MLAHWRRAPGQFATLLTGLMLATALWSAVQAINAEARRAYDRAAATLASAAEPALIRPGGQITIAEFVALRRAGWPVSPVIEGRLPLNPASGDPEGPRLIGVDLLSAPPGLGVPPGAGLGPVDLLRAPGRLIAPPALAARLEGVAGLPPVVASAGLPADRVLTDIATADRLLGRGGAIDRLILTGPAGPGALRDLAPGVMRIEPGQAGEIGDLTRSFHLNLTAFGLMSFAVGLFIVHGTIGLAFEQRRGTMRTLRALGLSARRLALLALAELAVLGLIGGALGLAAGHLIAGLLLPDVAATLRGLYGAPVAGGLTADPRWAVQGLAMTLAGTLAAAGAGLWRMVHLPILAGARPRAWARASARGRGRMALAGLGLIGLGLGAPMLAPGLAGGFGLLAGLLLGGAALLPPVLGQLLRLGRRLARGPLADWAWADAEQRLPGLSLALMALLLALAGNIGVSTMVGSFRGTFVAWLDQRLSADLYLSVRDPAERAALADWAARRPDLVEAVLTQRAIPLRLAGQPAEVMVIENSGFYRRAWPLLAARPDAWDSLHAGAGVMISEQMHHRAGLDLGARLAVTPALTLPVVGIYPDYGNPRGQALIAEALLERPGTGLPVPAPGGVALLGPDPEALRRALTTELGLDPGQIVDQAQVRGLSLSIFERTFAVTGALNVLTLGVAAVAMLTALLTLAGPRLGQIAPVWALGVARGRLAALELVQNLGLALLTFGLALPLGMALAYGLLAVVNVAAFGWRLPMQVFPGDLARLLGLALLAAGLASLWPLRAILRRPPVRYLRVFADER